MNTTRSDSFMGFSRVEVRKVRCPLCKAQPHQACVDGTGRRLPSDHRERVADYHSRDRRKPPGTRGSHVAELKSLRAGIIATACPRCGAAPEEQCTWSRNTDRKLRPHKERMHAYKAAADASAHGNSATTTDSSGGE